MSYTVLENILCVDIINVIDTFTDNTVKPTNILKLNKHTDFLTKLNKRFTDQSKYKGLMDSNKIDDFTDDANAIDAYLTYLRSVSSYMEANFYVEDTYSNMCDTPTRRMRFYNGKLRYAYNWSGSFVRLYNVYIKTICVEYKYMDGSIETIKNPEPQSYFLPYKHISQTRYIDKCDILAHCGSFWCDEYCLFQPRYPSFDDIYIKC